MPNQKHAQNPFLESLQIAGQILIAIGTPPLFALKILLWTVIWTGNLGLKIAQKALNLIQGVLETAAWLQKTLFQSIIILTHHLRNALVQITHDTLKNLSESQNQLISFQKKTANLARSAINFLPVKTGPLLHQVLFAFQSLLPRTHKRLPIRPEKKRPPKPPVSFLSKLRYFTIGVLAFFFLFFAPFWIKSQLDLLPNPRLLTVRDIPVSTKILDRHGTLLYQIYSGENRTIVPLASLPGYVVDATIAIEDKNFYHHFGFDPVGIARAAFANTLGNGGTQGGSTITQQLVKSALLTPEQTFSRKIKEVILAFWAERLYSKGEILTMYLNQVPYGGAAYGIEAASQTYFHKDAKNLDLAQAALLAGLPSAPTTYSPFGSHPELAKERQEQVLDAMVSQGYITAFQADAAKNEPLRFAPIPTEIKAPHFVMYVKDYLIQKYGIRQVEQGGLEVITSLDYPTYEAVSRFVHDGVEKQNSLHVGNGAALVTNPSTGEILAMVGSADFFDTAHDGNVNVTIANRSPGSSIKPLNYALAFDRGLITPSTIIDDSPTVYRTAGSPPYAPQNYDNRFHGRVTARVALGSSYNIPAVKVLEKNGVDNFLDFAAKMGITTLTDRSRFGLSITLGGGEVKMVDMAAAYSVFANGGVKVDLKPVLKVTDFRGNVLEDNTNPYPLTANRSSVISPQTAFLISNILADDSARAPTFGRGSILNIPGHTVSVKTGTAETKRDNWTIGYTPDVLAAVWVGNNDNSPMSPFLESGNTGAAAIWNPIMTYLLANKPDEPITPPDNIVAIPICTINGLLTCENCPSTRTEYFTKGTEPKVACKITPEDLEKMKKVQEQNKPNP